MPNFQITAPDGTNYQVTAPEGATQDQVMQYVQQQHAAKAPPDPQQSSGDAELAAGQQAGKNIANIPLVGGALTAADQAARQYLPLGLGTDVGAVARYAARNLTGHPESFHDALAYSGGQSQGEQGESPIAGTIGGTVGGLGQAVALTPLLKAAMPFKAALALKSGQAVKNVARVAGTGAIAGGELGGATGAVQGGINGGDPSLGHAALGTLTGGAEGAAEGTVGGLGAAGLAGGAKGLKLLLASDSTKSIAALAKVFNVSPNDLASAHAQFRLDTGGTLDPKTGIVTGGRAPSMGELTDLYNRGEIQTMVGKNPIVGARVAQAADQSAATLPGRMGTNVTQTLGPAEDPAALVQARDANMTAAMTPIRNQQIPIDPEDVEFLRGEVLPNSGLTQQGRRLVHQDLDQGHLTVGNADTLRQNLSARAAANPGEGYDQLAAGIRQLATDHSQEYSQALDQYARDQAYINGHAHGLSGKTPGQTADQGLIADIGTPEGQAGYRSGLATRYNADAGKSASSAATLARSLPIDTDSTANLHSTFSPIAVDRLRTAAGAESRGLESLNSIAPTTPAPRQQVDLGQVGMSVLSHTPAVKGWHLIKALKLGMSDDVAKITADYLTDPKMAPAGINLLKAHGMSQAQMRQFIQKAGLGGSAAATILSNNGN